MLNPQIADLDRAFGPLLDSTDVESSVEFDETSGDIVVTVRLGCTEFALTPDVAERLASDLTVDVADARSMTE